MQSNKVVKSYARANLSTMYSRRARNGNSAGGSCKQRMGLPRVTRVAGFTLLELMIVAAIMAVLMAHYLGQRADILTFAAMGAIPASVCSWLSGKISDARIA